MNDDVESGQVEFKQSVCAGVIKTIIAFANTEGGDLYIGVADDGEVVGVENLDDELTRLSSMMRDSIRPDILMHCSVRPDMTDGKSIIHVHVEGAQSARTTSPRRALGRRASLSEAALQHSPLASPPSSI